MSTSRYKRVFRELEDESVLDSADPFDIYSLHFVYMPMLEGALREFVAVWNKHPIRTAHHKEPNGLWILSKLSLPLS